MASDNDTQLPPSVIVAKQSAVIIFDLIATLFALVCVVILAIRGDMIPSVFPIIIGLYFGKSRSYGQP